jgi:hypothetical protein
MLPWSRGGPTSLGNLVLLCHRHHWLVHDGGWMIARSGEGELVTFEPDPTAPMHVGRDPTAGRA